MRQAFRIFTEGQRARALKALGERMLGFEVEMRDPKRSLDQNAMLWAMLTELAPQMPIRGEYLTPDQLKSVFMHALGREQQNLPTLDGKSWFSAGFRSSRMRKSEFSELLEFIIAEATQRGIQLQAVRSEEAA
ncbi:MAG: recombination protein NinB [Pseudomonadota bacterium]